MVYSYGQPRKAWWTVLRAKAFSLSWITKEMFLSDEPWTITKILMFFVLRPKRVFRSVQDGLAYFPQ
jgi:hypothetical protein